MIKDLLRKYLKGELNEREVSRLSELLSKHEGDQEIQELLESTWAEFAGDRLPHDTLDRMTSQVFTRIGRTQSRTVTAKLQLWKYAAVLLVLIGIGLFIYKSADTGTELIVVHSTGNSENLRIELPDHSKVILSANSRLSYDQIAMRSGNREVTLEGEAYFEVEKKSEHQTFKVSTSDLTVSVHGTEFNVNSHWNQTEVILEGGLVSLDLHDASAQEIKMKPGDLVSYSAREKGNILRETLSETRTHTSWREGVLIFENAPLWKVFKRLESTYGLRIEADEQGIGDEPMTTAIPIDNLDQVLAILRGFTNYEYKLADGLLIVK